ncbi:MAG: hypothetical protein IPG17_03730 [Sandaracinaceae bacterium]|nr:hypothetical protein [Sandaracinaceae bacterium]
MSEALTVHSHFEDVAALAAGLADRVEEGRVILYGPTNYEAGETIPFAILLVDGSPVIEGHGVVAASVDGGEDRDPGFRYDVVLTDLQMDARSEIMFARILMAGESESRETSLPDEEAAGFEQVDVGGSEDMGGFQDESTAVADLSSHAAAMMPSAGRDVAPKAAPVPVEVDEDDDVPVSTTVEPEAFSVTKGQFVEPARDSYDDDVDEDASQAASGVVLVDGAMAPPVAPPAPAGFTVARLAAVGLSRPVHAATWWPEPTPRPDADPSSGAFQYSGALPIPNQPPRPDLDPSQRVAPAPHPVQEGAAPAPMPRPAPRDVRATVNEHAATFAADNDDPSDEVSDVEDDVDVDLE